jgi:hypothetical protein
VSLRVEPPKPLGAPVDPVDTDRDGFFEDADPCPAAAEDGAEPSPEDGCPAASAGGAVSGASAGGAVSGASAGGAVSGVSDAGPGDAGAPSDAGLYTRPALH